MKRKRPTPELYLAFPQAVAALRQQFEATDREIACWIFFDQIKAYGHVELSDSPELSLMGIGLTNWTQASRDSSSYVNALQGAFFLRTDIENFVPQARYISFADLIHRWSALCQTEGAAAAFIHTRIAQDRLHDFAPGLGPTILNQTHFTTNIPYPPAEWAMFNLAEVEAIEASDFPDSARTSSEIGCLRSAPATPLPVQRPAIIVRKLNVMFAELRPIWTNIENDINNGHKNGLRTQAKLPAHGKWNMTEALKWAAENRTLKNEKAASIVANDPSSDLSVLLAQLLKL